MNQITTVNIQRPRTDERLLWNIICGDIASKVLLVAHNLKLFPLLAEKPCTLTDICNAIKIDRRRTAEAILAVLVSIELLLSRSKITIRCAPGAGEFLSRGEETTSVILHS